MKSFFKVFTIFTPAQLRQCALIVFAMVVGAMLEAVGIGAILPLISVMGQPDFLDRHAELQWGTSLLGIEDHTDLIIAGAVGLILVYIVKNLYMAWQAKLQIDFSLKYQIYFSGQLLANYLSKPYFFHLSHNTATLLRNVSAGGQVVFSAILIPTFMLLTEFITAGTIWLMLVFLDAFTAVVVAGLMAALIYALLKSFRRKIAEVGRIQNDYAAIYLKWLNQGLGAIKETKVMRRERFFLHEFLRSYELYGNANRKFLFLSQLPRMIIETLVVCALLVMIVVKLAMGTAPMDIVPLLGVLALAAFRLMPSANRIVNLANGIKFQMPLFDELYREFLAIKSRAVHQRELQLALDSGKMGFRQELSVEHLEFSYPGTGQLVLQDVSFRVPKGAFVGIVGPSGAGKTTFVDILLGLLKPVRGSIKVDGVDIQQDIRAWQANLAYVPQTIYLIDGTIRENIALGMRTENIDDEKVERVLKMAELHEFVSAQPAGANTMVGERGVRLSGGQRQRIGIARALYQEPEVLILDEATSALDNETEESITHTILKLKGQITILSIAHRVSTLAECDFKVKFAEGRAELLEKA
ncbi:ABC transporter ATP-binding protein [Selenomonas sputigena]|uniref:ABC transporter ATP-binding protein n=1 Tax=Selenomonas sputigena TaxID=69823 RepID=A0ABV3X4U8_9FIRM